MSYNLVDKTTGALTRVAGNAAYTDTNGGQYWATCNNQAANQIKIVTVSSDQNFVLEKNAIIFVKFDAANTYTATAGAPVKLNVNGTGDKNVYYANTNAPTGTNTTAFGRQNYINQYVYDGINWVWQGSSSDNDTANKVVQTVTTGNADYEVLFSNTADNTTRTEGARKNNNLKFNPSTGNLQTTKINGVTVGNSPKFTDTVDAASLTYSNTTSGLSATKVQGAVDELASEKKDEYTTITYAQWQQLTPAQQAAKDYYISDYPSSAITAGNVSYNNSSSGMSANNVQSAVDELKSGLTGVQRNMTNVLTGSDAMQSDHSVHEAVLTRNGMIYVGFFNMTLTSAVSAWTPFAHVEANLKYITLCNGAYGGPANSSYCTKDGNMILTQPADAGTQIHIVLVGVADFT